MLDILLLELGVHLNMPAFLVQACEIEIPTCLQGRSERGRPEFEQLDHRTRLKRRP